MCTEEREPQVGLSPSQMHNIRNQCGWKDKPEDLVLETRNQFYPSLSQLPLVTWRDVAGPQSREWPSAALWKELHTPQEGRDHKGWSGFQ